MLRKAVDSIQSIMLANSWVHLMGGIRIIILRKFLHTELVLWCWVECYIKFNDQRDIHWASFWSAGWAYRMEWAVGQRNFKNIASSNREPKMRRWVLDKMLWFCLRIRFTLEIWKKTKHYEYNQSMGDSSMIIISTWRTWHM